MAHMMQDFDILALRAGSTPWWNTPALRHLFVNVPADATPEQWKQAVKFDTWEIQLRAVRESPDDLLVYNNKDGQPFWVREQDIPLVDGERIIKRVGPDGYEEKFGRCTDQYHPVQPSDQFDFVARIAEEGDCEIATLGSCLNGRKVWAQLDLGESWEINGKQVKGYLSILNTNDGTGALLIKVTLIEVVCHNTFTAASMGKGESADFFFKLNHKTKFTPQLANSLRERAGLARKQVRAFQDIARELASAYMPRTDVIDFVAKLSGSADAFTSMPKDTPASVLDAMLAADQIEQDLELGHADPSRLNRVGSRILEHMLAGTPGTRPLNGGLSKMDVFDHITYYGSNDQRIARSPGAVVDSSLNGRADQLKTKALTMLRAN